MNIISKELSQKIWTCHHEIQKANELASDLKKQLEKTGDAHFIDAFGRTRQISMGVPSGNDSARIFDVRPKLALAVIHAHIAEKESELIALNEEAKILVSES